MTKPPATSGFTESGLSNHNPPLISICITVLLLCSGVAACGPAAGPVGPTPTPTLVLGPLPGGITLPRGSAAPFAINGNELVWSGIPDERGVCPKQFIYAANVRAFHPVEIWQARPCIAIYDIRISTRWIVWIGGVAPAGSIWAMNRETGKIKRVASQVYRLANHPCPTPDCVPPFAMSLDGNTLAWSHFIFGPEGNLITSQIRLRRLPKGRARTVYQTTAYCEMEIDPQIAGGRLVWLRARWQRDVVVSGVPPAQCEGNLATNVMTKHLGGRVQSLAGGGSASNPQTNGNFVSWQDSQKASPACTCYGLILLDTRTRKRRLVSRTVGDSRLLGHLLVWVSRPAQLTAVQVLSIARGLPVSTRVVASTIRTVAANGTVSSSSFIRALGWGSENRIVWEIDKVTSPRPARVRVGIRDVVKAKKA